MKNDPKSMYWFAFCGKCWAKVAVDAADLSKLDMFRI